MMAKINLGQGVSINYSDLNPTSEATALLLHGLGATAESWELQFLPLIDSGFRVITPDLRGFGRSSYPGGRNDAQVMAGDMFRLLQHLEIDSCIVVGISMGGTVGLQLTLEHSTHVDALIFINTFARLRPRRITSWYFYAVRLILVHILGVRIQARLVAKKLFPDPNQLQYRDIFYSQIIQANPQAYRSTMRSFIKFDVSSKLSEIEIPVLVITGERDSIVPPEMQTELSLKISNAHHEVIQDAGHAVIVDKPTELNRVMLKFLLQFR